MERRIQAEKRERYLASAEYAELVAKQTKEEQNIAISKAAQISDKDVSLAKQSTSDAADASASTRKTTRMPGSGRRRSSMDRVLSGSGCTASARTVTARDGRQSSGRSGPPPGGHGWIYDHI